MNHHDEPFNMSGPEFAGLTFDARWALKKQLRIRDRNRNISAMMKRRQRASSQHALVVCLGFGVALVIIVWGMLS